jgi:hypothetical protein
MPRYYFDFQYLNSQNCDDVGSELADDHAAGPHTVIIFKRAAEPLSNTAHVAESLSGANPLPKFSLHSNHHVCIAIIMSAPRPLASAGRGLLSAMLL